MPVHPHGPAAEPISLQCRTWTFAEPSSICVLPANPAARRRRVRSGTGRRETHVSPGLPLGSPTPRSRDRIHPMLHTTDCAGQGHQASRGEGVDLVVLAAAIERPASPVPTTPRRCWPRVLRHRARARHRCLARQVNVRWWQVARLGRAPRTPRRWPAR